MSDRLDPHLDERLSRLAPELAGADWLDVRRRAGTPAPRARRRLVAALVAAALALAAAVPALGLGERVLDLLGVTQTDEDVPGAAGVGPLPYVYGDEVRGYGEPTRLGAPLRPRFVGESVATVVPSPGGRYLAYHSSQNRTPVLRVHDLKTGDDRTLAYGAQMVAWGARGLAYFQADPPEYRERFGYVGRVVVRATPDAEPVTWVDGLGRYAVIAWAGPRLVIESGGCNVRASTSDPPSGPFCRSALPPGPYVLDGPGRARSLGAHRVDAVSPDGRLGFGPLQPPTSDGGTHLAHVVDLATGRRVARLDLRRVAEGFRLFASRGYHPGAWVGERIATVAHVDVNRLVVLRYRSGRLMLEQALRLDRDYFPGTFGPNFSSPVFADEAGRRVVMRVSAEYRGSGSRGVRAFLTCDLETRRCRAGRPLRGGLSLGVVFNPSRPLREARDRTG